MIAAGSNKLFSPKPPPAHGVLPANATALIESVQYGAP
jgi:hypothetical protein